MIVRKASKRIESSMAATIKDIAQSLKLSMSTVSYALNGGPRSVSEDVRRKVALRARELGYRPNKIAKSLATGRAHAIALVPPQVSEDWFLSPYLILAFNGVVKEAGRRGLDVVVYTAVEEADPSEVMAKFQDGRVDGVIFVAPFVDKQLHSFASTCPLPSAAITGQPVDGISSFCVDNERGIRLSLQHLYGLGHRKIAHIAGRRGLQDAEARRMAFLNFADEMELCQSPGYCEEGDFTIEGGRRAMRQLLSLPERPTAVVCANDEMAIGALKQAANMGIRVPHDVSVTGFDDSPNSSFVIPSLTTVRQPIMSMGEAAVGALASLIAGDPYPSLTIFPTELIVRDSTSYPTKETP